MKTILLKVDKNILINPVEDVQYVIVPKGEVEIDVVMEKSGVTSELLAIYAPRNTDKVILKTKSHHKVPNTTCFVNVKAALFDSAHSDYVGKIIIDKKAQQTASYLEDNVLVIGENIKNNSQPILEIEADDVKASHGATTGRIDKSQIYYLQSRGLTVKEAEETIIEGFFESSLSKINDEKIKEQVRKEIYA